MSNANNATGVEDFINNWNVEFPEFTLEATDLKKPQMFIQALFKIFDKLGIDCDVAISPPTEEERDEHTPYYWDLLPVINMTRIVNHLFSFLHSPDSLKSISLAHFLQPTISSSHPILLILFNFMIFNKHQLKDIARSEEELFQKREQVHMLEEKKIKLQELLNERANEKGKRSERLSKIDHDIKQFEEELKQEKAAHEEEKQDLEVLLKEIQQLEVTVEQKRAHRDSIMTEITRKRALRVYDADDIRAQAERAAQNVQEADEKLESLKQTLMQKETACNHLQNINPNLVAANNFLHEIAQLTESLKELECPENSPGEGEDELAMAQMELKDLSAQLAEVQQTRRDNAKVFAENRARRQEQRAITIRALEEAEYTDKRCREQSEKAILIVKEIQRQTHEYEVERQKGIKELDDFKKEMQHALKTFSEALLDEVAGAENNIVNKLKTLQD